MVNLGIKIFETQLLEAVMLSKAIPCIQINSINR